MVSATTVNNIRIRPYISSDYETIKAIYSGAGFFDPETDKEERLAEKVRRDPRSLLVAFEDNTIVGTVSIMEDGRIAQIFRLFCLPGKEMEILPALIQEAKSELHQREYKEVHITALEDDVVRHQLYQQNGFTKGNVYRWFYTTSLEEYS